MTCNTYPQIETKRGDTLEMTFARRNADGSPFDLTGYTVACEAAMSGTVYPLTATVADVLGGLVSITALATDTDDWPLSVFAGPKMLCDIEFSLGALVESTETFEIIVKQDITNA